MTLQQAAGYQYLIEKLQLSQFTCGFTLFPDVLLNRIPVGSLANCCNIIAIGPKLTAPKFFFYRWLASKYFSGCYALEYLHNPTGRYLRMRPAQEVNMVLVTADRFHFNRMPFGNSFSRFLDNNCHLRI